VSSFLSASLADIFLIVILLGPPALAMQTGALWNTFPVLFQQKQFLIYSDQFVQDALYVITPQNRWLIGYAGDCYQVASGQCEMQLTYPEKSDLCLGTWFRATEQPVRSLPR